MGKMDPKWDKFGTFSYQISVHFGLFRHSMLEAVESCYKGYATKQKKKIRHVKYSEYTTYFSITSIYQFLKFVRLVFYIATHTRKIILVEEAIEMVIQYT